MIAALLRSTTRLFSTPCINSPQVIDEMYKSFRKHYALSHIYSCLCLAYIHIFSYSCIEVCSLLSHMKSSENISELFKSPSHLFSYDIRMTISTILWATTASPSKQHSFGSQTAWLRVFSNNLTVIAIIHFLTSIVYIAFYTLPGYSRIF